MNTRTGNLKGDTAAEFLEHLSGGLDPDKMNQLLDLLFKLAEEHGSTTCALGDDASVRLQSGDRLLHERPLPRSKGKLRMLCARLAFRCQQLSGREVSPYGAELEFPYPPTNRICQVRFQNTTSAVQLAFDLRPAS